MKVAFFCEPVSPSTSDVDVGDVDASDVDVGDVDASDVDVGDVDASDVDIEVTAKCGVVSSSRIVPLAVARAMVALTGFDTFTPSVSSFSFVVSPLTWTVMVLETSPGAKVNVPDAA